MEYQNLDDLLSSTQMYYDKVHADLVSASRLAKYRKSREYRLIRIATQRALGPAVCTTRADDVEKLIELTAAVKTAEQVYKKDRVKFSIQVFKKRFSEYITKIATPLIHSADDSCLDDLGRDATALYMELQAWEVCTKEELEAKLNSADSLEFEANLRADFIRDHGAEYLQNNAEKFTLVLRMSACVKVAQEKRLAVFN